jgi:hypothetical protein
LHPSFSLSDRQVGTLGSVVASPASYMFAFHPESTERGAIELQLIRHDRSWSEALCFV